MEASGSIPLRPTNSEPGLVAGFVVSGVTLFSGWPDQTFKSDITYIAANKKAPRRGLRSGVHNWTVGAVSGQQRYRLENLARLYLKCQACRVSSGAGFAQSGLCLGFGLARCV